MTLLQNHVTSAEKNVNDQGLFLLSDINECLSNQTNDCNPDNQVCANTDGGYLCTCISGFRKQGDGCVGKVGNKQKKKDLYETWFVKKIMHQGTA